MKLLIPAFVLLLASVIASGEVTPDQRALETRFDKVLSADNVRNWIQTLSARPHHIGSPYGKKNAEFMADLFRSWGYETKIETFHVLFPTPKTRILEMDRPQHFKAGLKEVPIQGDASSLYIKEQLPIYHAFSTDGDVTGEVVYVNYGMRSDYKELRLHGIDVRGKIVIARDGRSWRGAKPKIAAEYGAIGCIIFSDPAGDGYYWGEVYPEGGWRNENSAQRGSVIDFTEHNGDPLTPFVPAFQKARRISRSASGSITKIPVLPVSYKDALPILRAIRGPVAPETWRGALPIPYHMGPGPARVRLKLEFEWNTVPAYNVIARITGSRFPDQWIIRGNHHDAWVYGAMDPVSGMAAVLEEARGIAELTKTGWRPKRTLIYAAWDGEEGGLLGSTEWVEAHIDELRKKAVTYINSDSNSRGFFAFQGSATLERFINQVAADVEDPEKQVSVLDRARAYWILNGSSPDEARERKDLRIFPAGSGSDYSPFLQHAGIASVDIAFGGEEEYGQYHSIYDNFDHYERFGDPTFEYGVALAKVGGRCMLRLADAELLPFDFAGFADNISHYVKNLQRLIAQRREEQSEENRRIKEKTYDLYFDPNLRFVVPSIEPPIPDLNFVPLVKAVERLEMSAKDYSQATARMGSKNIDRVNEILMHMEEALTRKEGLPGRRWFRHQINAPAADAPHGAGVLPGIRAAIDRKDWRLANQQIEVVAETLENFKRKVDLAAATMAQQVELKPCRPEGLGEEVLCGRMMVYENRLKQSSRRIPVSFIILPALDAKEKKEPLFELAGTAFAELYASTFRIYRQNRDVVLVDQRGSGLSYPLNCKTEKKGPQDFLDDAFSTEAIKRCVQSLEKIADLNFYTTSIAMNDLDDVRAALGYEKIHLIGSSYFSRAAQEYIRRHGEHVRSAILMHVVPASMILPARHATSAQRAIEILWVDCAADAACSRAFPNVETEWRDLLQRLRNKPARMKYKQTEIQIRAEVFAEFVRRQLYSPSTSRKLPYLIHQAAIGNFSPYLDSVIPEDLREDPNDNNGWYFSMICAENAPFINLPQTRAVNGKTDFGNYRVEQQQQICAQWPHKSTPEEIQKPVVSDVPILLMSGHKDPVTPPEFAAEVSNTFRNSVHVTIPEGGHLFTGLEHAECVQNMIAEFLETLTVRDDSCVHSMRPPAFQTK